MVYYKKGYVYNTIFPREFLKTSIICSFFGIICTLKHEGDQMQREAGSSG